MSKISKFYAKKKRLLKLYHGDSPYDVTSLSGTIFDGLFLTAQFYTQYPS